MPGDTPDCCPNSPVFSLRRGPTSLSTWAFFSYIFLIIMVAILATFLWVIIFVEPFDVVVEDASFSNYGVSAKKNRFLGNFNVTVGFNNPNQRVTIKYYWVNMTMQRDNQSLASIILKPFSQPRANFTMLHARFKCNNVKIYESRTLSDLGLTPSGDVKIDLRIKVKVMYYWRRWKSKRHWIEVWCSNVRSRPPESITPHRTHCLVDH